MKITLRKANALQEKITAAIAAIPLEFEIAISKFDKPHSKLNEAREELQKAINQRKALYEVLYGIRKGLDFENHLSGVSNMLSDMAYVKALGTTVAFAHNARVFTPDYETLTKKHEDLQKDKVVTGRYGEVTPKEEFRISILSKELAKEYGTFFNGVGKRLQSISDAILELNIKQEILLEDGWVKTLKEFDIL